MELVLKYLEAHRESILMDLDLIKNDTKTRYAIEKRKQLEPFLKQITRAVDILSSVPQANELLPGVSGSALSKDYEKLYDRIRNGEHVAVWVDCDWHDGTITRDIAAVKRFDYADINIGARGIEYGSVRKWKIENKTEKQAFIDECERLKLEFI